MQKVKPIFQALKQPPIWVPCSFKVKGLVNVRFGEGEFFVCGSCKHWLNFKCLKFPSYVIVTPCANFPKSCSFFEFNGVGERWCQMWI